MITWHYFHTNCPVVILHCFHTNCEVTILDYFDKKCHYFTLFLHILSCHYFHTNCHVIILHYFHTIGHVIILQIFRGGGGCRRRLGVCVWPYEHGDCRQNITSPTVLICTWPNRETRSFLPNKCSTVASPPRLQWPLPALWSSCTEMWCSLVQPSGCC